MITLPSKIMHNTSVRTLKVDGKHLFTGPRNEVLLGRCEKDFTAPLGKIEFFNNLSVVC